MGCFLPAQVVGRSVAAVTSVSRRCQEGGHLRGALCLTTSLVITSRRVSKTTLMPYYVDRQVHHSVQIADDASPPQLPSRPPSSFPFRPRPRCDRLRGRRCLHHRWRLDAVARIRGTKELYSRGWQGRGRSAQRCYDDAAQPAAQEMEEAGQGHGRCLRHEGDLQKHKVLVRP